MHFYVAPWVWGWHRALVQMRARSCFCWWCVEGKSLPVMSAQGIECRKSSILPRITLQLELLRYQRSTYFMEAVSTPGCFLCSFKCQNRVRWGLCLWPMEFLHFVTNPAAWGFRPSFNPLFVILPVTVTAEVPLEGNINRGSSPSLVISGGLCVWSHKNFFSPFPSFLSVMKLLWKWSCGWTWLLAFLFPLVNSSVSLSSANTSSDTKTPLWEWHQHQAFSATCQGSQVQQHFHPHVMDHIRVMGEQLDSIVRRVFCNLTDLQAVLSFSGLVFVNAQVISPTCPEGNVKSDVLFCVTALCFCSSRAGWLCVIKSS